MSLKDTSDRFSHCIASVRDSEDNGLSLIRVVVDCGGAEYVLSPLQHRPSAVASSAGNCESGISCVFGDSVMFQQSELARFSAIVNEVAVISIAWSVTEIATVSESALLRHRCCKNG